MVVGKDVQKHAEEEQSTEMFIIRVAMTIQDVEVQIMETQEVVIHTLAV